jgi:folate-dependent phosphoribosylglycinamide formyltransferase PurN
MRKSRPWVAFYSHSGSEIQEICRELKIRPDIVCTNNPAGFIPFAAREVFKKRWKEDDYREVLSRYENPLVTLNGWMRIVPGPICSDFEIYNGHPALISEYPELKGKDKQEDVINQTEKYPFIGSVIHKCIEELDAGEILVEERVHNMKVHNRDLIYDILRDTSLRTWLKFLPQHL